MPPETRTIATADGAELCAEAFGEAGDPPILLIMGMGASMIWWEEPFCEQLAAGGRRVIRYDHRDTGRSTADPPGHPRYGGDELVSDALAVLDGFGVGAAHLVGLSMGGALAQLVALRAPDRVTSLTLISTTAATPESGDELPGPADAYRRFLQEAGPAPDDPAAVAERTLAELRVLAGEERPFDERRARALVNGDVDRARDPASAGNHAMIDPPGTDGLSLQELGMPTLVVHGTADPLFPPAHGHALADAIRGARLLVLAGAGHGLGPVDWDEVIPAILRVTA